jgi:hypothetical protein
MKMVRQRRRGLLVFALYGNVATAQPGRGEFVAEVRRWQENAKGEWSEEDVEAVAHHLNDLHYHYQ